MSEETKHKHKRDKVEKQHKKEKKEKRKDGKKSSGQLKTLGAAFSLLADEKAANPALAALFAAKVCFWGCSMPRVFLTTP